MMAQVERDGEMLLNSKTGPAACNMVDYVGEKTKALSMTTRS